MPTAARRGIGRGLLAPSQLLLKTGLTASALMETLPALADVPVIFISAHGRDETVARALRCLACQPTP